MKINFQYIIIFFALSLINCYKAKEELTFDKCPIEKNQFFESDYKGIIRIPEEDNDYLRTIGHLGIISFKTDYNDTENIFDSSDIQNLTLFKNIIIDDENNQYDVICRLWKPLNDKLKIFCKLEEKDLLYFENYIIFKDTTFEYKNKVFNILFEADKIVVHQIKENLPFLYSEKQIININNETDIYYMKFKYESYQNELLKLNGSGFKEIMIDNCTNDNINKELICPITKTKIEEILGLSGEEFNIGGFNYNYGYFLFDSVSRIKINYKYIEKKNIYISQIILKKSLGGKNEFIAYEVDATCDTNIISSSFTLSFSKYENPFTNYTCFFKKTETSDLILFMKFEKAGDYGWGLLFQQTFIGINIKYNFVINSGYIYDTVTIYDYFSNYILSYYPKILDFTQQDSIIMIFSGQILSNNNNKIRINPDSDDIECEKLSSMMKCNVSLSHFDYAEEGFYNIYFTNLYDDTLSIYEELPKFKVILPERNVLNIEIKYKDNKNTINLGKNGVLYFITDYDDTETNLFNISDIREKTLFNNIILDENKNGYDAKCKLWKPKNGKLILLCQINSSLKNGENLITFDKAHLMYNDIYINIILENVVKVKQYQYFIPFIYSDKQIIDIEEDKKSYEIKFYYELFNNDILVIKGELDNYIGLYDCEVNNNEIVCIISKKRIEENLMLVTENFVLGTMNDHIGVLFFDLANNIYINHKITQKESINIDISKTKLIEDDTDFYTPVAYETDISSIPNLITRRFSLKFYDNHYESCYFKKLEHNQYLYLLCLITTTGYSYLEEITEKIELNFIHYKYNFIILPGENKNGIYAYYYGTSVDLIYPEELDLTSNKNLMLRYIMKNPDYSQQIRLNIYSSELYCENLIKMKKCFVNLTHFPYQETGLYPTYHRDSHGNPSIYYEANKIKVILPQIKKIEIKIEKEYNNKAITVGPKGILYFFTSYNDTDNIFNSSEIYKNTIFKNTITDEYLYYIQYKYDVLCRLWKPTTGNLMLFCDLNSILKRQPESYSLDYTFFIYNDIKVIINATTKFEIQQLKINIPFLYSDKQIIDLEKNVTFYELLFHIGTYNNELLSLHNGSGDSKAYGIFDNCEIKDNNLICNISKVKIEEIVIYSGQVSNLFYLYNLEGFDKFIISPEILINYDSNKKENISIEINKLLLNRTEKNSLIYYETNVTSMQNVFTSYFYLDFINNNKASCFFKKNEGINLLLLCHMIKEGTYFLEEINEEIFLDNIHIKYNFIIKPGNYNEKFVISKETGTFFWLNYPQILDFSFNDNSNIYFFGENPALAKGIKLNIYSEYLTCQNGKGVKSCTISKEYFERKPSGYYYLYHSSNLNNYSIYYELSPIRIILPIDKEFIIRIKKEDNQYKRFVGQKGIIFFISDYNDNKYNIFNISDIEEKTLFDTVLTDQFDDKYNMTCRLWKPLNDTIRIFCKLHEDLNRDENYINIEKATFEYNEYNISIIFESDDYYQIEFINDTIPFLYSEKQEINIEEDIFSYNLKFFIDSFNDELLILHGSSLGEIIFDNCTKNSKELLCPITKDQIEEILVTDGQKFNLGLVNDKFGVYDFDSIPEIIFNYKNITKQDIYLNITKLLKPWGEALTYIAFDTNITSINNVITEKFNLKFLYNSKTPCIFKKNNIDNLLLLCFFDYGGYYPLSPTTSEILLNNIHIKYNFRIQPISDLEKANIDYSKFVYFKDSYPKILDFTNQETLIIRLFFPVSLNINTYRLNPDSSDLKCNKNKDFLICTVPLTHFDFLNSGYYRVHSSVYSGKLSIYYELNPFNVILPERKFLILLIEGDDNKETLNVGKYGTFYFVTNYIDNVTRIFNPSDIEDKTKFITTATDEYNNKYTNINCRLWKSMDEKIKVLCKMNRNFKNTIQNIKLGNANFIYDEYKILVKSMTSIEINQLSYSFPFVYSDKQILNFEENKEIYELKFKVDFYDKNLLYLYDNQFLYYFVLDNCKIEEKELLCKVPKKQIENYYLSSKDFFRLGIMDDNIGTLLANLVGNIYIHYENIIKKDINIENIKLIQNIAEISTYFAYETNIDSISELTSKKFVLKFNNKYDIKCYFKKSVNNKKLLILCESTNQQGILYFGKSTKIIILDNIYYKYNFIIHPIENYEIINIEGYDEPFKLIYPETLKLDLEQKLKLRYIIETTRETAIIKLHPDSPSLECQNLIGMKMCRVSYENIPAVISGYYYTHHLNHLNKFSINYEINPINIIFPNYTKIRIGIQDEYNTDIIKLGHKGILYLVSNYSDTDAILNSSDVKFIGEFYNSLSNKTYKADCKFWNPRKKNSRLLCQMKEDFSLGEQIIYIKEIFFIYKMYNISIYSEAQNIKVKQLETKISFLFSDIQEIDLNKESNTFLKFEKYFYNEYDDSLYLYQNDLRFSKLECYDNSYEVICNITKDELLQILSFNGAKYKLALKINSEGMFIIPSVLDIIINIQSYEKDVEIHIEKLLTPKIKKNQFIAYETNLKNISGFEFTDYFNISTDKNENLNCLFKNNFKDNLLILCKVEKEGMFSLGKIKDANIIKTNLFYNFMIKDSENNEELSISGDGTIITSVYPKEFNFTQNDSYIITYETQFPEKIDKLFLNKDSQLSLECKNYIWYKQCNITKEHFNNLETNYFYTYQAINVDSKSILYEVDPVYIILDKKDNNTSESYSYLTIILYAIEGAILLGMIVFLIRYCIKKRKKVNKGEKREIKYPSPNIEVSFLPGENDEKKSRDNSSSSTSDNNLIIN